MKERLVAGASALGLGLLAVGCGGGGDGDDGSALVGEVTTTSATSASVPGCDVDGATDADPASIPLNVVGGADTVDAYRW